MLRRRSRKGKKREKGEGGATEGEASPEREGPGQDGKQEPSRRSRLLQLASSATLAMICTISLKRLSRPYEVYGWRFFLPASFKQLGLSAAEWQDEVLARRRVAFIGGHHRSGTTVLWDKLSGHPSIAAFGSQRLTGVDFSEGVFVQDVYPTFGVGDDFERELSAAQRENRRRGREEDKVVGVGQFARLFVRNLREVLGELAWVRRDERADDDEPRGMGRYALASESVVHWTEAHALVSAESQTRILNRFGYHWTEAKLRSNETKVLLEKSPTNALVSRFLQAVVNLGRCEASACWTPDPPTFNGVRGAAAFIFVQRHPIATSLAHLEWRDCAGLTLHALLAHWVAVSFYMRLDAPKLQDVTFVSLEAFAADPADTLRALFAFLRLAPLDPDDLARAVLDVDPDPNEKYYRPYCDSHLANHSDLARDWADPVSRLGYDLDEWAARCAFLDAADVEFSGDHPDPAVP